MMKAFAGWVLVGRVSALTLTSGFAILSIVFPPLLLISLASLALVGLRMGAGEGLLMAVSSAVLMFALSLSGSPTIWMGFMICTTLWMLTWLVSQVYRRYASTAVMINTAGAIGALLVINAYLILGDPAEHWLGLLDQHLRPQLAQTQLVRDAAELNQLLMGFSQVMTGGIAGLICLLTIVSLLLARWWQAILFNPGGFQREFHSLKLGRFTAWSMLALLTISLTGQLALATDLATVVWLLFLFQGLAVIHYLVLQAGMNIGWLLAIYILLAVIPYYTAPVLSGLGLIDTWFGFRSRINRQTPANNETVDDEESGKDG